MIGTILVTLLVAAIVGSYMTIVNRVLRSDEHWSESHMMKPGAKATTPAYACAAASLAHA